MKLSVLMLILFSSLSFASPAPNFSAETLDGNRLTLKDSLKPGKVLLLCFWATWCAPCIEELKHVSEKIVSTPELPLDLLTINVDTSETTSDVKPTLRMLGFKFPVVSDAKHEIFGLYQSTKTLPFSVLIDSNGEIAATFSGYDPAMFDKVKTVVEKSPKEKDATL